MEEKKFDPWQFVGFFLIALILTWMLYNQPPVEEVPTEIAQTESSVEGNKVVVLDQTPNEEQLNAAYGSFANLFQATTSENVKIENEKLDLIFNSKGAQISSLLLKEFNNYKEEPLFLIKENQNFNYSFTTSDGRVLNSIDFYFTPKLTERSGNQILTFTAKVSDSQFLVFEYEIKANDYMIDFSIRSEGMRSLINTREEQNITWDLKAFRNSRSIEYENRYHLLTYGFEDDKVDYLSGASDDEEEDEEVHWISYKQHFFNSILIPTKSFDSVNFTSENLVDSDIIDQEYTKVYKTKIPVISSGEINHNFKWYFGPTEYDTLAQYKLGIEDSIDFGWGIFGWINKYIFTPTFNFLSGFLPYGIAIIVLTVLVRLVMSPVTYKSYVSQIKMKVLKPEIDVITAKHKDDSVKRQQETMALYTKAGANPMAGCLPALIQLPVFYALFSFFPVAFALREKSFLWADDLSSYDSVYELGFNIPFYGDHISLFPILASIAIFFYTMMTAGQQTAPQQPGMPNMKIIMYIMPLMMLFFFNNYASGLSLYYFVSNVLTIVLMLVIKNFIVDDAKILMQLEENKKKPKKKGGFSARLQAAMEQAEQQKKAKGNR
ncbi:membrane protein insertase YidC [Candidatus Arcticimaribacter forsetii]|uniref:membrane protein insertase YidC n=1 Tax=Candidatus Arcticimaribacter forsetii TaxID=2820661 RepID=UPI0020771291|nr:membrane protein insertase YidC [Candidatus Arcticimaribacter forsetii]MDB4674896.1 membrane protein insertase YidC [Flavobacteriaceae bacterium]